MSAALKECRKFLENRYRKLVGLQTGFAQAIAESGPAWLPVTLEDLGKTSKQEDHAAALIDPEIGTLLYVIEYQKGQDVVALIVKALALRTRLLLGVDKPSEKLARDHLGSWRVALYWLVEQESLSQTWERAIAKLRGDAPHMEEIPIDLICKGSDGWPSAFESHGFPRLLLNTRRVLKIASRTEVERWSAADSLVREELAGFSGKFTDKTQRELALAVERQLEVLKTQGIASTGGGILPTVGYKLAKTLGIRNFRNIREATMELATDGVSCSVITGPNGSGKSSLFEAICLGTFGSSYRYLDYLREIGRAHV